MKIADIRRQNLNIWVSTHGIPEKERSLFSQLRGVGSFGERVARRLEVDYKMGDGFLDQPIKEAAPAGAKVATVEPAQVPAAPKLQWITDEEYEILSKYRGATPEGQLSLRRLALRLPQAKFNGVASANKA